MELFLDFPRHPCIMGQWYSEEEAMQENSTESRKKMMMIWWWSWNKRFVPIISWSDNVPEWSWFLSVLCRVQEKGQILLPHKDSTLRTLPHRSVIKPILNEGWMKGKFYNHFGKRSYDLTHQEWDHMNLYYKIISSAVRNGAYRGGGGMMDCNEATISQEGGSTFQKRGVGEEQAELG